MRALLRNQGGGAVVELALFTFVFVPLAFYGAWFADAIHFGIKAQEASITPAWDVTAHRLHDTLSGSDPKGTFYDPAMNKAVTDINSDLAKTFDSTDSSGTATRQSSVISADPMKISCSMVAAPNGAAWTSTVDASRHPTDTWVACQSKVTLHTTGFQTSFDQDRAGNNFMIASALTKISLCGIGPGFDGCGNGQPTNGFYVFNDDWGLEYGDSNTLQAGSASGNQAYFTIANEYFGTAGTPSIVTLAVGGFGDQGNTSAFRLTYQRGAEGSFSATEGASGQSGPHGGPSYPHTGGAWHEENTAHQDISEKTWTNTRADQKYLAVKGFPKDGS